MSCILYLGGFEKNECAILDEKFKSQKSIKHQKIKNYIAN